MFHIVLVEPLIPQNTGNIGRLCAATGSRLHLIEPLGFEITDKNVRRAGLDYWPHIDLHTHSSWEAFLSESGVEQSRLWFFSTHATKIYYQAEFRDGDAFVFGNETGGLAASFHQRYAEQRLRIPIDNPAVRSLNLANAATAVLYEARRQLVK